MGIVHTDEAYKTIKVGIEEEICFIQIYRPEAKNAINNDLITEMNSVLDHCSDDIKIVVIEGLPDVFCFGADFGEIERDSDISTATTHDVSELYSLWKKLASGPFISIANAKGKTNAGGVGFIAACDITLCEKDTLFSLSELLFGLMPACVMPFLVNRIGLSKSNYMTLTTQPVTGIQAEKWGLIDICGSDSDIEQRKQLVRLRRLSKRAISRYKNYANKFRSIFDDFEEHALEANRQVFSDTDNIDNIIKYVETGKFPWEP